jgi:hypothetical protein
LEKILGKKRGTLKFGKRWKKKKFCKKRGVSHKFFKIEKFSKNFLIFGEKKGGFFGKKKKKKNLF